MRVFLRCPVRVWRVIRSQPLPCTAPGSRAPKPRPAASLPAWRSWVTLKRLSFPSDRGTVKKAQMESQVCVEKDYICRLQFLSNGTVEDNMMDVYINCINCLNWTPQQSSSREKVRSSNVTSVTKSSRKTLISSSTLGGELLSRM